MERKEMTNSTFENMLEEAQPKLAMFTTHEITTEDSIEKKTTKKFIISNETNFLKRKRKSEINGRDFKCTICDIAYLSYPALYTHHRNKHSLIPITNKKTFFKSSLATNSKFKYTKLNPYSATGQREILLKYYYEILTEYTLNPSSIFYFPTASFEDDDLTLFFQQVENLNKSAKSDLELNQSSIGEVLVIYLNLMMKITKDENVVRLLVLFIYLIKEYLDIFGWQYHDHMIKLGIATDLPRNKSFFMKFNCVDLPDMMNDFVTNFLPLDSNIVKQEKELIDICHNFCLWLTSRKLTSFTLIRLED